MNTDTQQELHEAGTYFKTVTWYRQMFAKSNNQSKSLNFANDLDKVITIFTGYFQNNWDFDVNDSFNSVLITIRYPELEITNSQRKRHIMKELFVRFDLKITRSGKLQFFTSTNNFKGCRMRLSDREIMRGYQHSHQPSNSNPAADEGIEHPNFVDGFNNWKNFCMGRSDFGDLMIRLRNVKITEHWEEFELFVITITNFLAWESLAGVPYIKIQRIEDAFNYNTFGVGNSRARMLTEQRFKDFKFGIPNSLRSAVHFNSIITGYLTANRPTIKLGVHGPKIVWNELDNEIFKAQIINYFDTIPDSEVENCKQLFLCHLNEETKEYTAIIDNDGPVQAGYSTTISQTRYALLQDRLIDKTMYFRGQTIVPKVDFIDHWLSSAVNVDTSVTTENTGVQVYINPYFKNLFIALYEEALKIKIHELHEIEDITPGQSFIGANSSIEEATTADTPELLESI
jgi:hypothetical protein